MMDESTAIARVRDHLAELTRSVNGRPVGSSANHAAEAYIAGILSEAGLEVEQQRFDCIDWRLNSIDLRIGDNHLPVVANHYLPSCDVTAPAITAGNLLELEEKTLPGRIIILHNSLTAEPYFPKNFPFFTVDEHKYIIDLLEAGRPSAVIAVSHETNRPTPIFEDGDFGIPSVTVSADTGATLLATPGSPVTVNINSTALPSYGANVIGRLAAHAREKIVICAHFDTKPGTPGALDNAAGVAAMLILAERLAKTFRGINLEFVAFNGEDHFAAPGQVAYLANDGAEFGRIRLAVNFDGVGLKDNQNTAAFFACPESWVTRVRTWLSQISNLQETDPWPQGDHTIFAMQGIPSIALTSADIQKLIDSVIHTPDDTLDIVSPRRIATVACQMAALLNEIGPPVITTP